MVFKLFSSSSGGFAYNDYDNWNTNSNCSSHLCKKYSTIDLANNAKDNNNKQALVSQVESAYL